MRDHWGACRQGMSPSPAVGPLSNAPMGLSPLFLAHRTTLWLPGSPPGQRAAADFRSRAVLWREHKGDSERLFCWLLEAPGGQGDPQGCGSLETQRTHRYAWPPSRGLGGRSQGRQNAFQCPRATAVPSLRPTASWGFSPRVQGQWPGPREGHQDRHRQRGASPPSTLRNGTN